MTEGDSSNSIIRRLEVQHSTSGGPPVSREELEARILGRSLPPKNQSSKPEASKVLLKALNRLYKPRYNNSPR